MATLNPYLHFNGNTEEAFIFYKSVFGGSFSALQRFKDIDMGEQKISETDKNKIAHISLPIGEHSVLMTSDALDSMGHTLVCGDNSYISIGAETKEEADKLYNGLSDGGKIEMAIGDAFWGAYFGMFTDKFGIKWMINFDYSRK